MGVRGLTTYINYNQNSILQDHLLHDCNLVIDGHSLCAQLYASSRFFSAFGGDYDKFAAYVKTFFKSLRKCKVTPYVLFDGSYERRKLKTAYSRLRSKISGASRLDPITQNSLKLFPLLLRDVFKEVLIELQVAFTVCEFEADDEIAAMARYLECPVLSYDSDFFIYNVLYIPFNTLETKPVPADEDGTRIFVLECKIYKVENLTGHFGGLNKELLPLLATLLGNDYVEKRVFSKFFSHLKMPKSKKNRNEQQRCIHGLFTWLQNETLETAIEKILGRMKKKQKAKVFYILKKSISGYNRKQCRSLKYFNLDNENDVAEDDIEIPNVNIEEGDGEDDTSDNDSDKDDNLHDESDINSDNDENNENEDKLPDENDESETESIDNDNIELDLGIPDWFADGIRSNHIPHSCINLYTHHLHFCSPQAEDYTDEDSFLCTLPILRYAFDLLTDFSEENCTYVSREKKSSYRRIFVGKEYATARMIEMPFSNLTKDNFHMCFKHFLETKLPNLNDALISMLPESFQLAMISVLWWVANCKVTLSNVHSFFITFIMLEVIDEKTGTFRGHHFFNNKHATKIEELKNRDPQVVDSEDLFLNKNKVSYEDCLIAASVLLKHFEIDDSLKKKPKSYDHKKIHSFAQLQCCLQQFNCLNTLCHFPYTSTKYSKCYNGTFIYNMSLKLENQIDLYNYVKQYIKGADTVVTYYKSLCEVFEKCSEAMGVSTERWTGKKRNRSRKNKKNSLDDDLYFIMKGFESEVVI